MTTTPDDRDDRNTEGRPRPIVRTTAINDDEHTADHHRPFFEAE